MEYIYFILFKEDQHTGFSKSVCITFSNVAFIW